MTSAFQKIDRAKKHLLELGRFLDQENPFSYMLQTNLKTGERATYAKRNSEVARNVALITGDVIHNLRAALDHCYWDIVSSQVENEAEKREIQFPFSKSKESFEEVLKKTHAHRISDEFVQILRNLRPFEEAGGSINLYAIHRLDILDKHRLLIPVGDFTKINSSEIQRQVPDFPVSIINCAFGQNQRDVVWNIAPMNRAERRSRRLKSEILEQELQVPVRIVFSSTAIVDGREVKPTLERFVQITSEATKKLKDASDQHLILRRQDIRDADT